MKSTKKTKQKLESIGIGSDPSDSRLKIGLLKKYIKILKIIQVKPKPKALSKQQKRFVIIKSTGRQQENQEFRG